MRFCSESSNEIRMKFLRQIRTNFNNQIIISIFKKNSAKNRQHFLKYPNEVRGIFSMKFEYTKPDDSSSGSCTKNITIEMDVFKSIYLGIYNLSVKLWFMVLSFISYTDSSEAIQYSHQFRFFFGDIFWFIIQIISRVMKKKHHKQIMIEVDFSMPHTFLYSQFVV